MVHSGRMRWEFPIDLSKAEDKLCSSLGTRSKFYCFLRVIRHLVFDASFQDQLASMYQGRPSGKSPVAPALLAMVVLLQAYTGASDAEAIVCITADRRWQLVLGCLGTDKPLLSQKTLAFFRKRLVDTEMDKQLMARTVQLTRESGLFDPKKVGKLRVAIDSAP